MCSFFRRAKLACGGTTSRLIATSFFIHANCEIYGNLMLHHKTLCSHFQYAVYELAEPMFSKAISFHLHLFEKHNFNRTTELDGDNLTLTYTYVCRYLCEWD